MLRVATGNEEGLIRPPQVSYFDRLVTTCTHALRALQPIIFQEPPLVVSETQNGYPRVTYFATTFRDFAIIYDPVFARAIIRLPRFPDTEEALINEGRPFQEVRNVLGPDNVLTCPASNHKRFRAHAETFFNQAHIHIFGEDILNLAQQEIQSWGQGNINLSNKIPKFTATVIAKYGVGYDGPIEKVSQAVQHIAWHVAMRLFKVPAFCLWVHHCIRQTCSYVFGWDRPLSEEQAHPIIEQALNRTLGTVEAIDTNQHQSPPPIQSYCQTMVDAKDQNGNALFSQDEIVSTAKMLFFTGQETTQSALIWAVYQLGLYAEWQERVYVEWLESEVDELAFALTNKTLEAIIKETLRLNPPAYQQPRAAQQDLVLGNRYFIPKGTALVISHYFQQRDPARWGEDAALFRPDRFLEQQDIVHNHQDPWLVFGAGVNACLGRSLALLELRCFLFTLIRSCTWRVVDPTVQQQGFISLGTNKDVLINIESRVQSL